MGALHNAALMARDATFRDRALIALVYCAREVTTEATTTESHPQRLAFARSVIQAPSSYADTVAWALAADPEVSKFSLAQAIAVGDPLNLGTSEGVLLERVRVMWNHLARVFGDPRQAG